MIGDMHGTPRIAIINPDTLAVLGLKNILQTIMPVIEVHAFTSFYDFRQCLAGDDADCSCPHQDRAKDFYHYFVTVDVVIANRVFFLENRRKTIVLVPRVEMQAQLSDFHCLCTGAPEPLLLRSLLALEQKAHAGGRNLPSLTQDHGKGMLSSREVEVMTLIVRGYINKEIAARLNIGLATVITHRRNIMEKLGIKSVSALTIYAVMHGYVDIGSI